MKEYVTIIKDLCTIIFTCVATVLGILTYLRAKATVLQPIRTEVVKKQSAMLSELLTVISQEEIFAFDYIQIVFVNIYSVLINYGFFFSNQKELEESISSKRCARIPCGEENILKDFTLLQPFDSEQDPEKAKRENLELRKKEYEKAKKEGIIIIDSIITTNEHATFVKKLNDFLSNPPSREMAFNAALKVEMSAGEIHFQEAMKLPEGSEMIKILQKINGDDKEHEQRIRAYMKDKGIKILKAF